MNPASPSPSLSTQLWFLRFGGLGSLSEGFLSSQLDHHASNLLLPPSLEALTSHLNALSFLLVQVYNKGKQLFELPLSSSSLFAVEGADLRKFSKEGGEVLRTRVELMRRLVDAVEKCLSPLTDNQQQLLKNTLGNNNNNNNNNSFPSTTNSSSLIPRVAEELVGLSLESVQQLENLLNTEHEHHEALLRFNGLTVDEKRYLTLPYLHAQQLNSTLLSTYHSRCKRLQGEYQQLSTSLVHQYALNFSRSRERQVRRLNKLNDSWLQSRLRRLQLRKKNNNNNNNGNERRNRKKLSRNERASRLLQGIPIEEATTNNCVKENDDNNNNNNNNNKDEAEGGDFDDEDDDDMDDGVIALSSSSSPTEYLRNITFIARLQTILMSHGHPYGKRVGHFTTEFASSFSNECNGKGEDSKKGLEENPHLEVFAVALPPDCDLSRARKLVLSELDRMHKMLINRYALEFGAGFQDEQNARWCCEAAIENVVIPQIYSVLFRLYTTQYHTHDQLLSQKIASLSSLLFSPASLGVPALYCLGLEAPQNKDNSSDELSDKMLRRSGDWSRKSEDKAMIYSDAITTLRRLTLFQTATMKVECLVQTAKAIFQAINDYTISKGLRKPVMGADELLPLFSYVVTKANPPNLHSECSFIADLASEELMMGQEGYCLATFQAALQFLLQFDPGELASSSLP